VRKERIMTPITTAIPSRQRFAPISALQSAAWAAWNASYSAETPATCQAISRALYQQDIHERIAALFARLDAQNRQLDSLS
jgi:hypothetical protein